MENRKINIQVTKSILSSFSSRDEANIQKI